jgi:hypothetical protein
MDNLLKYRTYFAAQEESDSMYLCMSMELWLFVMDGL